jgi:AIPR protein
MDRITQSYLEELRQDQSISSDIAEDTAFELFSCYCVISDVYDDIFDVNDVHVAGGNDLAIDGAAIIVNGALVTSSEDVDGLLQTNGYLDVTFVFVQAKSGKNFKGEEMAALGEGVLQFFTDPLTFSVNDQLANYHAIMNKIFHHSNKFTRQKPMCLLYFVTTGLWQDEPYLVQKMHVAEERLQELNYFSRQMYSALGADELQGKYLRSKNSAQAEITFALKVVMPDIEGVDQAYLGLLPASEFLRLVTDQAGGIRKSLFYDNVRDFQDYNAVNEEIQATLMDPNGRARFCVLNNGVTLVARNLQATGNKFVLTDYQIVNGCQTSHVLFDQRQYLTDNVYVPLKIIVTAEDELTGAVITATNRQTQVTTEDLYALSDFQKKLESLFAAYPERKRLLYERRSRQYNAQSGIEKVRIITKAIEIRAFAAMFLDDPHRASRYYGELRAQVGQKIFNKDHKFEPYYVAAYAYYRLDYLFRNGLLPAYYKPSRYHLLMAFRYLSSTADMPALTANKMVKYCHDICDQLWNDDCSTDLFTKAINAVDQALEDAALTRDVVKTQTFTDAVKSALGVPGRQQGNLASST